MSRIIKKGIYSYIILTSNFKYLAHWKSGTVIKRRRGCNKPGTKGKIIIGQDKIKTLQFLRDHIPTMEVLNLEKHLFEKL